MAGGSVATVDLLLGVHVNASHLGDRLVVVDIANRGSSGHVLRDDQPQRRFAGAFANSSACVATSPVRLWPKSASRVVRTDALSSS